MKKLFVFTLVLGLTVTLFPHQGWSKARRISIATAGVGGTYYQIGAAIANILTQHMEGIEATAVTTAGAVENVRLLGKKQADIGFTLALLNAKAAKGTGPFKKKPVQLRAVGTLYPNVAMMVTLKGSGIEGYRQLKGKRISVGKAGSGLEGMFRTVAQAAGLRKDGKYAGFSPVYLGTGPTGDALRDGRIDAGYMGGSLFSPAIKSLATQKNIFIIPLEADIAEAVAQKTGHTLNKYWAEAGIGPGFVKDGWQLDATLQLAVRPEESEEFVYGVLKAIFDHIAFMRKSHAAANYITLKRAPVKAGLPFHPGAIRYFKEKGVWNQ